MSVGPEGAPGQATTADSTGTTAAAPQGNGGQPATPSQTTTAGPDAGQESFFDPKSIEDKPELLAAYKQMQSKFTKSQQKLKEGLKKVEAYDTFMQNPQGYLQQLAAQYGYQLVQGKPGEENTDWSPKTWDDVLGRAKQEALKELEPLIGEVRQLKQQNVEQYLDSKYTDWRTYEDDMRGLLAEHPSLARDPDKLYRLAVPEEVWEARATKAAMAKLRTAGEAGQISGPGATTKQTTPAPEGIKSFNDAVAYAKAKLAREGVKLPGA